MTDPKQVAPTDPARLPALGRALIFLDKPRNVTRIVYGLYVTCAGLVLLDLTYEKHPYFEIEHLFGFYGWYGFVMCALLVITAKALRTVLMRPEDYYAPHDTQAEPHPEHDLGLESIDD